MKPLLIIQRLALALLLLGFAMPGYVSADGLDLIVSVPQGDDDEDKDKDKNTQYSLSIKEAKWKSDKSQLKAKGQGSNGQKVTLLSAASGQVLGQTTVKSGKWKIKASISGTVPCRVRAQSAGAPAVEKDVKNSQKDCDDGNGNPPRHLRRHHPWQATTRCLRPMTWVCTAPIRITACSAFSLPTMC
ncbi:hypothetical protein [Thiolapillus sp.]|uniref:hypothetical protein n=1 Tax=Thiolapillus sp. TaxID=2017437 RepID=UPI003AF712EE